MSKLGDTLKTGARAIYQRIHHTLPGPVGDAVTEVVFRASGKPYVYRQTDEGASAESTYFPTCAHAA